MSLFGLLVSCGGSGSSDSSVDGGAGDSGLVVNPPKTDANTGLSRCGDASLGPEETCDDGNEISGDGCDDTCLVEGNFACPQVGEACIQIVTCGNGKIEGDETCDDRNLTSGDGCSASCLSEAGWSCAVAGTACVASTCGDGVVAGFEACDDGGSQMPDGCDDACRLVPGFHCPEAGVPCTPTVCGDGRVEGNEECDDQNNDVGDGCTPLCTREPVCADGACVAVCGDSVVRAPETCDDGNTVSGDGCDAACSTEQGFSCVEVALPDPSEVSLPVTVRDFVNSCGTGNRLLEGQPGALAPYGHPDFQCYADGLELGMVATNLDSEGKPVRIANGQTASDASFSTWYRSNSDFNRAISSTLTLPQIGSGAYQFDRGSFFPATGMGFDVEDCSGSPCELTHEDALGTGDVNFYFTSETRYWFQYSGTEDLAFSGDDDVWVFINDRLAVDLGGVHGREDATVNLGDEAVRAALDLNLGGTYEVVVFHAERRRNHSQYRLTLSNFVQSPSTCTDACGDGVVSSREVCDEGANNGGGDGSDYGGCAADCRLEPYCGDGVVQEDAGEICDDGVNLGGLATSCAPGCQSLGAACGDGVVQTETGEECDDGNTVDGDGCSASCAAEFVVE